MSNDDEQASRGRRFHAGDSIEDLCRVCKMVRGHSVIVVDSEGGIMSERSGAWHHEYVDGFSNQWKLP